MRDAVPNLGPLGFGGASVGNLYREVDDLTAARVIDAFWEAGVRYFDTAPHYGLGLSEKRLGDSLRQRPRAEFIVSSKVGRLLKPDPTGATETNAEGFMVRSTLRRTWDFTAAGVRQSIEESLQRLGLDRLDVAYLHDPEEHLDIVLAEAVPELMQLRSEGIVGAIGVGSKNTHALTQLIETGEMDIAMVAGRYTLLEQPAVHDVFPAAERHDTSIVAVGIYNSGLLASATSLKDATYEYGPVPQDILARAKRLAAACEEHDVALPHAAVQFALRQPLVINVTVGVGRLRHVPDTVRYAEQTLPQELWTDLADQGLIPAACK